VRGQGISGAFRLSIGPLCLLALAALPAAASAQSRHNYNIPAQDAVQGLQTYARQSGRQVIFSYELLAGKTVHGISGTLDDDAALSRLINGLGLTADTLDSTLITLKAVESPLDVAPPEIIVTARRRLEEISKTPASLAAATGRQLTEAGIYDVAQLQYQVSGLLVSHDRQGVNISIRGITTTDATTKGEPGINFNTDGIPVSRSEEQALGFFDLARVEVLSGPQGTLYGKSSTGGAINVITNAPAPHFEAAATAEVGNYDARHLSGMINLPLTDRIFLRAAIDARAHDGYVDLFDEQGRVVGHANDQQTTNGRLSLLARPGADLTIRATLTAGSVGGVGYGDNGTVIDINDAYSGKGTLRGFANAFTGHVDDHYTRLNTQIDKALGADTLTYLGGYSLYQTRNLTPEYGYDTVGNRLRLREQYSSTYQELRLSRDAQGRLDYVAGINAYTEVISENGHFWTFGDASVADVGYDPDYLNIINLLNRTSHTTWSAYGHATYALTPQWHLAGGLRASVDETTRAGTLASGPYAGAGPDGPVAWLNPEGTVCTGTDDCIGTPNNGHSRSTKLTYDLGLSYQSTPAQLWYANIATGYKPGGFNDFDPATGGAQTYAPEDMTAFEIGYKYRSANRVVFTSALYDYDYSRSQVTQMLELNNNPDDRVIYTRLAPIRMTGWESYLAVPLGQDTALNLTINYERARFGHFMAGPTFNLDFTGKPVDRVPNVMVAAGYDHVWRLRAGNGLKLHLETRYSAAYLVSDYFAGIQYRQVPFTRSSGSLSYTTRDGLTTWQAYVNNLENTVQITGGAQGYIPGVRYSAYGSVSEPRTYGLRATRHF
jgi:iron complex outermembrane receptor protein